MSGPDKPRDDEAPKRRVGGYGTPPERTRWQKGTSGNPKGRPKGSKGIQTVVRELCNSTVSVNVDGRRRRMPFTKALEIQLRADILSNSSAARYQALRLVALYGPRETIIEKEPVVTDDRLIEALAEFSDEEFAV